MSTSMEICILRMASCSSWNTTRTATLRLHCPYLKPMASEASSRSLEIVMGTGVFWSPNQEMAWMEKIFLHFFKSNFRKKIPQKIEKPKEGYLSLNIWTHHYLEHSSKFHWCLQTVSNWTACFSRVFESWSATGKSRQFLCKKTLLYTK